MPYVEKWKSGAYTVRPATFTALPGTGRHTPFSSSNHTVWSFDTTGTSVPETLETSVRGTRKLFADAGEIESSTRMVEGSGTRIVMVARCRRAAGGTISVKRPTLSVPPSRAARVTEPSVGPGTAGTVMSWTSWTAGSSGRLRF